MGKHKCLFRHCLSVLKNILVSAFVHDILCSVEKALFITFEGIDGSGKSTQVRLLADYLKNKGYQVYITREPGGTPLAEGLRDILLDKETGVLSPLSELFLYLASRREHLDKIIRPHLNKGIIVISDRFVDSSVAYQGSGRGIDLSKVDELNMLATDGQYPDITFLLDLEPEEAMARFSGERHLDRLESEGIGFLKKIREGYLWIAKTYPRRVRKIDAAMPEGPIFDEIVSMIDELL